MTHDVEGRRIVAPVSRDSGPHHQQSPRV